MQSPLVYIGAYLAKKNPEAYFKYSRFMLALNEVYLNLVCKAKGQEMPRDVVEEFTVRRLRLYFNDNVERDGNVYKLQAELIIPEGQIENFEKFTAARLGIADNSVRLERLERIIPGLVLFPTDDVECKFQLTVIVPFNSHGAVRQILKNEMLSERHEELLANINKAQSLAIVYNRVQEVAQKYEPENDAEVTGDDIILFSGHEMISFANIEKECPEDAMEIAETSLKDEKIGEPEKRFFENYIRQRRESALNTETAPRI